MKNNANKYGAVSAKVSAMRGKMLRDKDYDALLSKGTVPEIAEYLFTSESCGSHLSSLRSGEVHRAQLEYQLGRSFILQSMRLAGMIFGKERDILSLLLYEYEKENLLAYFRHLISERDAEFFFAGNDFVRVHSAVPYAQLAACHSFSEAADVLSETQYGALLSDLLRSEQPDYNQIERRLVEHYFDCSARLIEASFSKEDASVIVKQLEVEKDFRNILRILRLKKFYPGEEISKYLLRGGHRIRGAVLQELLSARDYDAALAVVQQTRYGRYFSGEAFLDNAYLVYLERDSRRILSGGGATILCVPAYFNLKRIEIHNIITIIEGKRYGCSREAIVQKLVGYHRRG